MIHPNPHHRLLLLLVSSLHSQRWPFHHAFHQSLKTRDYPTKNTQMLGVVTDCWNVVSKLGVLCQQRRKRQTFNPNCNISSTWRPRWVVYKSFQPSYFLCNKLYLRAGWKMSPETQKLVKNSPIQLPGWRVGKFTPSEIHQPRYLPEIREFLRVINCQWGPTTPWLFSCIIELLQNSTVDGGQYVSHGSSDSRTQSISN